MGTPGIRQAKHFTYFVERLTRSVIKRLPKKFVLAYTADFY
jgi:hypothetical protein